jgi:glycosyltransferase involved in cell wall biosynthesis
MDVDIVVVHYNYGHYLPAAMDGIALQTRKPKKVIVQDDKSPKHSLEELQEILKPYPWAELRRNKDNLGIVGNLRAGFFDGPVTSEAYMLHSADDYLIDPEFLQDALTILEENEDIVLVFGQVNCVDAQNRPRPISSGLVRRQHVDAEGPWTRIKAEDLRRELSYENTVPAICNVIRSNVHTREFPPLPIENPHCHDWQQWYMLTFHGDAARINRPVITYRWHEESLSAGFDKRNEEAALIELCYEQLMARPEVSEEDRKHLRRGRLRKRLRSKTMGGFIKSAIPALFGDGGWPLVKEEFFRRCERRAKLLHERARKRFLKKNAGTSW